MVSLLGLFQIADSFSQACELLFIFVFVRTEMCVDEYDIVDKKEGCFVVPVHCICLFLGHYLIDKSYCFERGTLDHDDSVMFCVSLVTKSIFYLRDKLFKKSRILLQEKDIEV